MRHEHTRLRRGHAFGQSRLPGGSLLLRVPAFQLLFLCRHLALELGCLGVRAGVVVLGSLALEVGYLNEQRSVPVILGLHLRAQGAGRCFGLRGF